MFLFIFQAKEKSNNFSTNKDKNQFYTVVVTPDTPLRFMRFLLTSPEKPQICDEGGKLT